MKLQPSDKPLDNRDSPHRIERSQLLLQIKSPIEMGFFFFLAMGRVKVEGEVVGKGEIHSLLEDGSDVEQYFCLLLGERLLLKGIVKQIDKLGDLKDISLPNTAYNIHLLRKYQHLLPIELQHPNQTAEIVRPITLILLLLRALILPNDLAPSINLEDSRHPVLVEVGHNYELLRIYPDCYRLQVQLFL